MPDLPMQTFCLKPKAQFQLKLLSLFDKLNGG